MHCGVQWSEELCEHCLDLLLLAVAQGCPHLWLRQRPGWHRLLALHAGGAGVGMGTACTAGVCVLGGSACRLGLTGLGQGLFGCAAAADLVIQAGGSLAGTAGPGCLQAGRCQKLTHCLKQQRQATRCRASSEACAHCLRQQEQPASRGRR